MTGQLKRDKALEMLKNPSYNIETIDDEFEYIATKLGITVEELRVYFNMPKNTIGIIKIKKHCSILVPGTTVYW